MIRFSAIADPMCEGAWVGTITLVLWALPA